MSCQHHEHTTLGQGSQSPARGNPPATCGRRADQSPPGTAAGARQQLRARGFTAVPNCLLRGQAELGLSAMELTLILHIWSYWWEEEVLPFPSAGALASAMGSSERQVREHLGRLARRGLIAIQPRYGTNGARLSNAYDLGPLLARLRDVGEGGERAPAPVPLQAGEDPVRPCAVPPMRPLAGDQDACPIQTHDQHQSIDDAPARVCQGARTGDAEPLPDPLQARIAEIGRRLDDRVPSVTARRIQRLRASGIDAESLDDLLDAALETLTPAIARPMPYLLTVLEGLASTRPAPGKKRLAQRPPAAAEHHREAAAEMAEDDAGANTVWGRIRIGLAETLGGHWPRLLAGLTQRADDGRELVLEAPDTATATVASRLSARIAAEAAACGMPRTIRVAAPRRDAS